MPDIKKAGLSGRISGASLLQIPSVLKINSGLTKIVAVEIILFCWLTHQSWYSQTKNIL
jgi:hypothetical protein